MTEQEIQQFIKEMTLEEKVNQMSQLTGDFFTGEMVVTGPMAEKGFTQENIALTGSVLGAVGAKNLKEWGERGDNPRFFRRAACIERKLEKMEMLDRPEAKKQLPLGFEIEGRSGKDVLVADDLGIIVGDKVILDGANFYLKYGEKVCLMGKNGTGKSTFVKAVLSGNNICQGEIKLGSNVSIGYIPQEIRFDDDKATILDTAKQFYDGTETHLRSSLAKFLFYGENVFKRVGTILIKKVIQTNNL